MKNILTTFALILAFTFAANANTGNPEKNSSEILFENMDVQYLVASSAEAHEILSATYNQSSEFFNITTEKTINFVQILDENGELVYQLPVGSKKLNLAILDFEKGMHKVNLLLEGGDVFIATELVKKF